MVNFNLWSYFGHDFSVAVNKKALEDAIRMTNIAVNLCLSNKFLQAQAKLEPW